METTTTPACGFEPLRASSRSPQTKGLAMSGTVVDAVGARCRESKALADALDAMMQVPNACCRRHDFAACAIDLAREHHRAIVLLVSAGELGSAAALMRPLLEASASAFWLVYAATDAEVDALPGTPQVENSLDDIPMLGEMLAELKSEFPAVVGMSEQLSKKGDGAARWLHKYTHGGTPQLARRDRANGWLVDEVILGLIRADMFLVLGASVQTLLCRDDDFRRYVFGRRDALSAEFTARFGIDVPGNQPHEHPSPKTTCVGAPLFETID